MKNGAVYLVLTCEVGIVLFSHVYSCSADLDKC